MFLELQNPIQTSPETCLIRNNQRHCVYFNIYINLDLSFFFFFFFFFFSISGDNSELKSHFNVDNYNINFNLYQKQLPSPKI